MKKNLFKFVNMVSLVAAFFIAVSPIFVFALPLNNPVQPIPYNVDPSQTVPYDSNNNSYSYPAPTSSTPVATPVSTSVISCSLNNPKLGDLFNYATCIISKSVIPLIFALAVVMFVWGVVQFVINTDDEAKKSKGKQFMVWGLIALTVMVSVWGLVKILGTTFGIEYVIPQVKSATS